MSYSDVALVDLIYESVCDSNALRELSAKLAAVTHSDSFWLLGDLSFGHNVPGKPEIKCVHGLTDDVVKHYEKGEYLRDPWLEAAPKAILDKTVSLERYVKQAAFRASPIYNEFIRGRADVMHCMSLPVRVGDQIFIYSMQRGQRGKPYDCTDENGFDALQPHLKRLLNARHLRSGGDPAAHLDALMVGPDAIILCDPEARIVHLNGPAAEMMASNSLLQKSASGRLELVRTGLDLHHAVCDAVRRGVPTFHASTVAGKRWIVRVDPASAGPPLAMVRVRDLAAHIERQVDAATVRFGFTPAEAKLAFSLASGMTIEDHAHSRGLKMPTVRSQMSSLLAKCNCDRQAQVISALHEVPAAPNLNRW
jgi:DNA-binding NarL/FixJ family response regulator